eukprot:1157129-Pelagomonas_calceolata.AAC.1
MFLLCEVSTLKVWGCQHKRAVFLSMCLPESRCKYLGMLFVCSPCSARVLALDTPHSLLLKSTTNSFIIGGCPERTQWADVLHFSKPAHAARNSEVQHLLERGETTYAEKTLPITIKEKDTHWCKRAVSLFRHKAGKGRASGPVAGPPRRGTPIFWRLNAVEAPGSRVSLRPPSSSTAIYVTLFQGPHLKLPFITFC